MQSVPKAVDTPVKADSSSIADTTAKTDSVAADQEAMTLPVLDALFYEPDFGKELISKLGLSAVKVAQLKNAAHASVSELRYETIVAENDGLHIYRDVYERGTNTVENAKAVLAVYGVDDKQLSMAEQKRLGAALASMNRDAHGRPIAPADGPEASKESVPQVDRRGPKKVRSP